jgi:ribonuclease HI
VNGVRYLAQFKSGVWNRAERSYDIMKREYRGALKALKKMRSYLISVHFILKTDATILVAQFNKAVTDLPSALLIHWITWIRLFDFEVKFI